MTPNPTLDNRATRRATVARQSRALSRRGEKSRENISLSLGYVVVDAARALTPEPRR